MRLPAKLFVAIPFAAALTAHADAVRTIPPGAVDGVLGHAVAIVQPPKPAEDIGHLVDVLVDATGRPMAAVLDVGGFLGVGNRKVAVTWDSLNFAVGKQGFVITVNLDADKLKAAPAYDGTSKPVQALSR